MVSICTAGKDSINAKCMEPNPERFELEEVKHVVLVLNTHFMF